MAVFGGRSRWASTLLGGVTFGAAVVLAFAGCGSRTSMLDQDIYLETAGTQNAGGGGHSGNVAGASSKGGGGNSGVVHGGSGGGGTVPTAGAAGAGGKAGTGMLDPVLAIAPCDKYCPGYGTQCAARLKGAECVPTCQGELNGSGKACQALGIQALTCLTPFFTPGGNNCDAAVGRALSKCKKVVDQFNACKKKAAGSNDPNPGTSPDFDPKLCASGDRYADAFTCLHSYSCDSGSYITFCNTDASNNTADCTCINPDGSQQTVKTKGGPAACDTATDACF